MVLFRRYSKESNLFLYGIYGFLMGAPSMMLGTIFIDTPFEIAAKINNYNERNHRS